MNAPHDRSRRRGRVPSTCASGATLRAARPHVNRQAIGAPETRIPLQRHQTPDQRPTQLRPPPTRLPATDSSDNDYHAIHVPVSGRWPCWPAQPPALSRAHRRPSPAPITLPSWWAPTPSVRRRTGRREHAEVTSLLARGRTATGSSCRRNRSPRSPGPTWLSAVGYQPALDSDRPAAARGCWTPATSSACCRHPPPEPTSTPPTMTTITTTATTRMSGSTHQPRRIGDQIAITRPGRSRQRRRTGPTPPTWPPNSPAGRAVRCRSGQLPHRDLHHQPRRVRLPGRPLPLHRSRSVACPPRRAQSRGSPRSTDRDAT